MLSGNSSNILSIEMNAVIIIPARLDSTRLPGKPLLLIAGKTVLQHVLDAAVQTVASHVIVATPDKEIAGFCRDIGALWFPTSPECATGTIRCASAAAKMRSPVPDVIVNWQVDEPWVKPKHVDRLIELTHVNAAPATLVAPLLEEWQQDPDVVKARVGALGQCLDFSRTYLPDSLQHVGVYGFPTAALLDIAKLDRTPLSRAESLEQLTWLENGIDTQAVPTDPTRAVNTLKDLKEAEKILCRLES